MALLIVDVQHDFLPGGALAVPDGDAVIAALVAAAPTVDLVVASRDAHPADHCSFAAQGGIWPPHCVEGTHGAELHPAECVLDVDDQQGNAHAVHSFGASHGVRHRTQGLPLRSSRCATHAVRS